MWNLPARNPGFTGRDDMLVAVREQLVAGDKAVVQAFQGMGGVGKTQLAVEYAYRFAGDYDLAWWVDSEQPGLIGDQFAALGMALGCVQPETGTEAVRAAVLGELRERGRWLLVFDNAERPADIAGWLPGGGHVLITSRERRWSEVAAPVEVDVLARAESVAILRDRVAELSEADAGRLAHELGDLPLAITQTAGFMAETGTSAPRCLDLMRTHAGQLLDQAAPGSYPRSLAAATALIADRLAAEDPAAVQLASICAFLAPEPIPEDVFTAAAAALPGELAAQAADPLGWPLTLAHLARQSLARVDQRGLQMHRLTQAILRDRLTPDQYTAARQCAEAILAASDPGDPCNPITWPRWAQLLPHLLATDLINTASHGLRWVACDACWYLIARGDAHSSYDFARRLYSQWSEHFGSTDDTVLGMAHQLAWALENMGRFTEARDLELDILTRARRVLGEDHVNTLVYANGLAMKFYALGDVREARDLDHDTLNRRRRLLGEDHPDTLRSAINLANDLRALGEVHAARALDYDTLNRRGRMLGEDHPDTLISANNLAIDLRLLGDLQAARDLDQDTLNCRRQVLGENHPDTLRSATGLATDLRLLGEAQAARNLNQDTLNRYSRVLGEDHRDTLISANNLAIDLRLLGDLQAARDLDQDTLNRLRRVLGEEHPDTLLSANNLAIDLATLGEHQAARDLDRDTLARRRRVLGDDHPDTLISANNLAADLRALGETNGDVP